MQTKMVQIYPVLQNVWTGFKPSFLEFAQPIGIMFPAEILYLLRLFGNRSLFLGGQDPLSSIGVKYYESQDLKLNCQCEKCEFQILLSRHQAGNKECFCVSVCYSRHSYYPSINCSLWNGTISICSFQHSFSFLAIYLFWYEVEKAQVAND